MVLTKILTLATFALALTLTWATDAPASGAEMLALRIDNASERKLRCVMMMAHFMSAEIGTAAAGKGITLELYRDSSDGSLFVFSGDGRRQMIESVICGLTGTWSTTRGNLALHDVRASSAPTARFLCRVTGRVRCSLTNGGS